MSRDSHQEFLTLTFILFLGSYFKGENIDSQINGNIRTKYMGIHGRFTAEKNVKEKLPIKAPSEKECQQQLSWSSFTGPFALT